MNRYLVNDISNCRAPIPVQMSPCSSLGLNPCGCDPSPAPTPAPCPDPVPPRPCLKPCSGGYGCGHGCGCGCGCGGVCPTGPTGATGPSGTTILGSYDSWDEFVVAHPTGNTGDAYIVGGELVVWNGTQWERMGSIVGPTGPAGETGATGATGTKGPTGATAPIIYPQPRKAA